MTPYILYGDPGSGSAPVEMALAEIGAPVELRHVPFESHAQLSEAHRRINPMGRIPVLVLPDGTVLTESLAILVTLADRHPEAGLLPPPGETARAVALRWMAVLAGEFYPHVTRYDFPERFSPDPAHAPAIRARAVEMGRDTLRVLEAHAGLDPLHLGDRFSLADLYTAVLSRWMNQKDGWLERDCPRIARLGALVRARPAVAPVWARHFSG